MWAAHSLLTSTVELRHLLLGQPLGGAVEGNLRSKHHREGELLLVLCHCRNVLQEETGSHCTTLLSSTHSARDSPSLMEHHPVKPAITPRLTGLDPHRTAVNARLVPLSDSSHQVLWNTGCVKVPGYP